MSLRTRARCGEVLSTWRPPIPSRFSTCAPNSTKSTLPWGHYTNKYALILFNTWKRTYTTIYFKRNISIIYIFGIWPYSNKYVHWLSWNPLKSNTHTSHRKRVIVLKGSCKAYLFIVGRIVSSTSNFCLYRKTKRRTFKCFSLEIKWSIFSFMPTSVVIWQASMETHRT